MAESVITLIIDGMDQSKFRVPRQLFGRKAKLLTKLYRPALHVTGAWVHGCFLDMIVSDEDLKNDSETQLEVLARCLNDILGLRKCLPLGLHLQQDNCCREGKNQWVWAFLLMLVIIRVFRFSVGGYLRPGHSHSA
jgi:hypothetical protein